MKIVDQGNVFAAESGRDCQSLCFPMPCMTSEGRWLCAFRAAPAKVSNVGQRPLLTWSDDRGETWRAPFAPFAPHDLEGRPGLFRIAALTDLGAGRLVAALNWVDFSDPEAAYFNEETEGLLDTRVFLSYSGDDGETWGRPRLMDTTPFNVPTPLTGPLLKLKNGDLACQIELNKAYADPSPWCHGSVMLFSEDGGETWPRHCVINQDPMNRIFYWDQRPAVLPDGSLFDVFWTFDRQTAEYLNIHACRSRDDGETWSPLWDTGVAGQPGPAFALDDGSLAMPVVDRRVAPKITVRRSGDGGTLWPENETLVVYDAAGETQTEKKSSMQDAWAEMYAFSVGLPNVAPLPDGGALLVYYAGSETDHTAIRWAEIR
jgi:hypothetical protein